MGAQPSAVPFPPVRPQARSEGSAFAGPAPSNPPVESVCQPWSVCRLGSTSRAGLGLGRRPLECRSIGATSQVRIHPRHPRKPVAPATGFGLAVGCVSRRHRRPVLARPIPHSKPVVAKGADRQRVAEFPARHGCLGWTQRTNSDAASAHLAEAALGEVGRPEAKRQPDPRTRRPVDRLRHTAAGRLNHVGSHRADQDTTIDRTAQRSS